MDKFEKLVEQCEASPSNIAKVASLPQSEGIWCVELLREEEFDYTVLQTYVCLTDKELDEETKKEK